MAGDTLTAETQAFLTEAGRRVLTEPPTIERIRRAVNEALTAPSVHEGAKARGARPRPIGLLTAGSLAAGLLAAGLVAAGPLAAGSLAAGSLAVGSLAA